MNNDLPLHLVVISPNAEATDIPCDLVTFFTLDDSSGHGGGSMGVRKGHISTVAALAKGKVTASAHGKAVAVFELECGVLSVENDIVTVITK